MPGGSPPGTKAAIASSHTGRPPRWVVRCSDGFQPPDIATMSQSSVRSVPPASATVTPPTAWRPSASRTTLADSSAAPLRSAAARIASLGSGRGSTMAATAMPAAARSCAVRRRVVVVGEHHGAAAGSDAEAVDVGAHRAGQHHAGPVVAAEHQRPLDRARSPARSAWPRSARGAGAADAGRARPVVGHPLDRAVGAAVVDAERRSCGVSTRTSGRLASSAATVAAHSAPGWPSIFAAPSAAGRRARNPRRTG